MLKNLSAHTTTNKHYTPHLPLQAYIMKCLLKGIGSWYSRPQSCLLFVHKVGLSGLLLTIRVKFSVRMWKMLHRGIIMLLRKITPLGLRDEAITFLMKFISYMTFMNIYKLLVCHHGSLWIYTFIYKNTHFKTGKWFLIVLPRTLFPTLQSGYVI